MNADESVNQVDIFQESQSYIYMTIELSEPIYPTPDFSIIKGDGSDLLAKYGQAPKFPSSRDAIQEFTSAVNFVV